MAVKKKPSRSKAVKAAVVAHALSDGKRKGKASLPSPTPSLVPSVCMAAVAFLGGLLTPPLLRAFPGAGGVRDSLSHVGNNPSDVTPDVTLPFPLPDFVPCTAGNLENYLHASPVTGLHIVCVESLFLNDDDDGEQQPLSDTSDMPHMLAESNALRLTFYKGAHDAPLRRRVVVRGRNAHDAGVYSVAWSDVKIKLIKGLGLAPEGPIQQPWAVFSSRGDRIVGGNDRLSSYPDDTGSNKHILHNVAASGMLVISQGGIWLWPPVREGFQRTIELAPSNVSGTSTEPRSVTIETLSLNPLVVSIGGFLTDDECDYIANTAKPSMKYSGVSLKDADKGRAASDWRTSQSTFLSANNDPILRDIEHRTASLTRVPITHQEYVQVLRYGTNEKYDAHHDYFDARSYQSDKGTLDLIQHGKRNRFATVFWYLTTVSEGGHTIFPRAGGLPPVNDYSDCSKGLKVQPQKGKVIIFYSLDASGVIDPLSLHGACPVGENNIKWAANKWIWNAPMGFVRE